MAVLFDTTYPPIAGAEGLRALHRGAGAVVAASGRVRCPAGAVPAGVGEACGRGAGRPVERQRAAGAAEAAGGDEAVKAALAAGPTV